MSSAKRLDVFAAGRLGNHLYFAAAARSVRRLVGDELEIVWHGDAAHLRDIESLIAFGPPRVARDRIRRSLLRGDAPMAGRNLLVRAAFKALLAIERRGKLLLLPENLESWDVGSANRFVIDDYMQHSVVVATPPSAKESSETERLSRLVPEGVLREIEMQKPIGVHMRYGDFIDAGLAQSWGVLDIEYFATAVSESRSGRGFAPVWVFSDEPQRAAADLRAAGIDDISTVAQFELNTTQELALLALCPRKVLSNSTFAWWAGYLSRVACEVIAPLPLTRSGEREGAALGTWLRCDAVWHDVIDVTSN